jgi:hypothetical protein
MTTERHPTLPPSKKTLRTTLVTTSVVSLFVATLFAAGGCTKSESPVTTGSDDAGNDTIPRDHDAADRRTDASLGSADAGPDGALQGTRYERVGKREGLAAAVKDVVEGPNGLVSSPSLAAYFQIRTGTVDAGGAPYSSSPSSGRPTQDR